MSDTYLVQMPAAEARRLAGIGPPWPATAEARCVAALTEWLHGVQLIGLPSNFNKMSAWPCAVRSIGAEGLHDHDLGHTGNHFAASSGTGRKDLMARMGHDSERSR